jgi:hypothetical protein
VKVTISESGSGGDYGGANIASVNVTVTDDTADAPTR